MKFLCDRCKTRYSIGDDRVRGKILKIRCKNCANVITVREGMAEADAEPSQGGPRRSAKPTTLAPPAQVTAPTNGAKPPAALEEEWYVSIDGEQSGPFSLHEAQKWIGARPVTADLHCWSEGFDDWLPVDKVSHFRGLRKKPVAAAPAPPPPAPPPRPAPPIEEDEPKPLFAATMAAIERDVSGARSAPEGGRGSIERDVSGARSAPEGGRGSIERDVSGARSAPEGGRGSIEKSAAAAAAPSARATPLGGIPSLPKASTNGTAPHAAIAPRPFPAPSAGSTTGPTAALRQTGGAPAIPAAAMKQSGAVPAIPAAAMKQSGAVPAIPAAALKQTGSVPAIPSVRGGTGPRPALPAMARPALPFDASDGGDVNTQIEAAPFADDARAAAELAARPRNLSSPFSAPSGFAPSASTTPAPAFAPPPSFPTPTPAAMPPASLSGTGANGAMAMAFNPEPRALPLAAPPPPMPEPEPEGDIEIGEVSRVVNLADLARNHAATKAAAAASRKSGALPRMRTTGANPSFNPDPIAAMVATPDAGYTNGAMVAEPAAPPQSHKKLYLLLGVVVLLLLGGVGAVVYAVTQTGDDESTAISQGREVDLTRPDDPLHHNDPRPDVKDPTVPHPNTNTHRPYVPPTGSNKTPQVIEPDTGSDTNALKPDEVEAMARTQSEATNRCYMRAQRGADAILVGDVKRINVTITVDKDGAVSTVDLSDHATDSLGKCLQSRIKGWRFHPSTKGLTTRLTLVFQAS